MPQQHSHRPGRLRQSNKAHKGGQHASKRLLKKAQGGKVGVGAPASAGGSGSGRVQRKNMTGQTLAQQGKKGRANQLKQLRDRKRAETWLAKRMSGMMSGGPALPASSSTSSAGPPLGASAGPAVDDTVVEDAAGAGAVSSDRYGGAGSPPKVVAVVPLGDNVDTHPVVALATSEASLTWTADGGLLVPGCGTDPISQHSVVGTAFMAEYRKYKQRLAFLGPSRHLLAILEAVKVADAVIFVINVANGEEHCVDPLGEQFLSTIRAQGMPTPVCIVQGLDEVPQRYKTAVRKYASRLFETEFGADVRVAEATNTVQVTRVLMNAPAKQLGWRGKRSYVVADRVDYKPNDDVAAAPPPPPGPGSSASTSPPIPRGTLRLFGYIRGMPFNVNQLVHVPDLGTFRVGRFLRAADPFTLARAVDADGAAAGETAAELEQPSLVLAEADPSKQDSVEMEAMPDTLAGEQTWPTEEEIHMYQNSGAPAATTDYTTEWLNAIGEADADEDDDDEAGNDAVQADGKDDTGEAAVEVETSHISSASSAAAAAGAAAAAQDSAFDEDYDEEEEDDDEYNDDARSVEMVTREEWERRKAAEAEEKDFPDEVDTPFDMSARMRFARYRALQSFRTSAWDPKENLPPSYSRIFEFEDFAANERRCCRQLKTVQRMQEQAIIAAFAPKSVQRALGLAAASTSGSATALASAASSASAVMTLEDAANADDSGDNTGEAPVEEDDATAMTAAEAEAETKGSVASAHEAHVAQVRDALSSTPELVPGLEGWAQSGSYVCIELMDVPAHLLCSRGGHTPLSLFSLLEHENRMTTLHVNMNTIDLPFEEQDGETETALLARAALPAGAYVPVKSKDTLVFVVGFRKFTARPVFSENNLNSDKHKFERFLLPRSRFSIASVFGPATFTSCPVLIFRTQSIPSREMAQVAPPMHLLQATRPPESALWDTLNMAVNTCSVLTRPPELIATASLTSVNTDRIILKQAILTGYPLRIRKRMAVVKYMFHNPEDVRYFKPAELSTKSGLSGHIKEPVGTHGIFKCFFSKPIASNDTVCLHLYKRVFPKFPYDNTPSALAVARARAAASREATEGGSGDPEAKEATYQEPRPDSELEHIPVPCF